MQSEAPEDPMLINMRQFLLLRIDYSEHERIETLLFALLPLLDIEDVKYLGHTIHRRIGEWLGKRGLAIQGGKIFDPDGDHAKKIQRAVKFLTNNGFTVVPS